MILIFQLFLKQQSQPKQTSVQISPLYKKTTWILGNKSRKGHAIWFWIKMKWASDLRRWPYKSEVTECTSMSLSEQALLVPSGTRWLSDPPCWPRHWHELDKNVLGKTKCKWLEEASIHTAGWSLPRVFSRIARASFRRLAASLYLFWSLNQNTCQCSAGGH